MISEESRFFASQNIQKASLFKPRRAFRIQAG